MSENTGTTTTTAAPNGGASAEQTGVTKEEFAPITSQEDFERRLGDRLGRERAKFSDYDDLKAKAAKFDEAEEANKTELQKAQDQANVEKARADALALDAAKFKVAAEKGVPANLLSGSTEAELTAAADALIAFRGEAPTPTTGTVVSHEGKTPESPAALNSDQLERDLKDKLGIT